MDAAKKAQGRVMPVMLTCEGVMPERWIGYAKYINHLMSSKAELMRQWPNPESVLQAVARPELEPWRQSIKEARKPHGISLPKNAWLVTLTAPHTPLFLANVATRRRAYLAWVTSAVSMRLLSQSLGAEGLHWMGCDWLKRLPASLPERAL